MWKKVLSGENWEGEFLNKRKDGTLYWEYARISPVKNENGVVTNLMGVKDDITQLKKLLEEIKVAKTRAEETSRLKTNFLANMSHELRTPLVGILGCASMIEEDTKEAKWIVQDFPAGKQKYDWSIFVWEKPREDYKIAIFEYPWEEGNKIDYSDDKFSILGPSFASCDQLSIEAEWPFIPSDFPNLKRVFISQKRWSGNLEGLEGADRKCQEEAEILGLKGNFKAFLGDDITFAQDRLNLDGIFVEAKANKVLPQIDIPSYTWKSFKEFLEKSPIDKKQKEAFISSHKSLETAFQKFLESWYAKEDEKTCHRLLGRNFEEFFKKFSNSLILNQGKFDEDFLRDFSNLWLGRVNKDSKGDCMTIFTKYPTSDLSRIYSFTTTCQNWKSSEEIIPGYSPEKSQEIQFPVCYTPQGKKINAAGVGGLSSGLIETEEKTQFFTSSLGKPCSTNQKLLCIEQ